MSGGDKTDSVLQRGMQRFISCGCQCPEDQPLWLCAIRVVKRTIAFHTSNGIVIAKGNKACLSLVQENKTNPS
jgi:hypothetical protein